MAKKDEQAGANPSPAGSEPGATATEAQQAAAPATASAATTPAAINPFAHIGDENWGVGGRYVANSSGARAPVTTEEKNHG